MSAICPVSDQVVEYLCAREGEPFFDKDYAAEFIFKSKTRSAESMQGGVFITRCDDKSMFLASSIVTLRESGTTSEYGMESVGVFLDFLGLTHKDVPVFDATHLGPFTAEGMLQLLELTHANFTLSQMHEDADTLCEKFRLHVNPPAKQIPRFPSVEVLAEGNVFRPQHWHNS